METKLLKASPIIERMLPILRKDVDLLIGEKIPLTLKIVIFDGDESSKIYTSHKKKFCEKLSIPCEIIVLPQHVSKSEFQNLIESMNSDPSVTGVLIQLPVPPHISALDLDNIISPEKDVDGFHHTVFKNLYSFEDISLYHCTPLAVSVILKENEIEISGKNVLIIGHGPTASTPLSMMMSMRGANVVTLHPDTEKKILIEHSTAADIICCSAERAKFLTEEFIKPSRHQIIIDLDVLKGDDGALVGSADYANLIGKVAGITPVPGAMGPLTILALIINHINAAKILQRKTYGRKKNGPL